MDLNTYLIKEKENKEVTLEADRMLLIGAINAINGVIRHIEKCNGN